MITLQVLHEGTHKGWFQGSLLLITSDSIGNRFQGSIFMITIYFQ